MTLPAPIPARLPMPAEIQDLSLWKILTSVIFPGAQDAATIVLALRYCERRGLDVLKKPVNIVPVYNRTLKRSVEMIWPSINETEITASRSKQWAGLDPPVFGPIETKTFIGQYQTAVTFPTWCERTVYRMIAGERRPFTERVHWLESYGRDKGGEAPNYMWAKRPHDQLAKVAKAAALRAAFPEESDGGPTAEEAEGMIIPGEDITPPPARTITAKPPKNGDGDDGPPADDSPDPSIPALSPYTIPVNSDADWRPFGEKLIAAVRGVTDITSITAWLNMNKANLEAMAGRAPKLHATLLRSIEAHKHNVANAEQADTLSRHAPPEGSDELPAGIDPETGEYQ